MISVKRSYRVEIPLNWGLSKNRKFLAKSKKILNPEYKKLKQFITFSFKVQNVEFRKDKIWMKILVYKKNNKGDCINLVEGIADGVKDALPHIDDNMFSCLIDWHIDKLNPRVEIILEQ